MTPAASRPLRRLQETDSVGYAGDPTRKEARPKFISREQFWFFHPFRVRYSEIDGQHVVFNAHYLTYFDTTITEYFRALGYDQYADAQTTGVDFHVVKSLIEYKARCCSTRKSKSARGWRGSAIQASPSNSPPF